MLSDVVIYYKLTLIILLLVFRDYRPMPELDRYDPQVLDDDDYEPLSITDRVAAERDMRRRDRDEAYRRGYDFLYGESCHLILKNLILSKIFYKRNY